MSARPVPQPGSGSRAPSRHPSAGAVGGGLEAAVRRLLHGPVVAVVTGEVEGPNRAVAVAALAVRGRQGRSRAERSKL